MESRARPLLTGLTLFLGLGVLACANKALVTPPGPDLAASGPYIIGPSDVLSISVWKNPELSVKGVPVRPDGKISTPLVNDVQAAGLTTDELKNVLTRELAEFVTTPDVTVVVTEINSKRIYVVGEVVRPTTIPLTQDLRVLDAIAIAGGFNSFADRDDVHILREAGSELVEYRFDLGAYLAGKAPGSNLTLRPGDTIVVPD
jgi:polysaccharide export outer membrane protein